MSKAYEEMSLEELEALNELRKKDKLKASLEAEDALQKAADKATYDAGIEAGAIEKYLKENPPKIKLDTTVTTPKDSGNDDLKVKGIKNFIKNNGGKWTEYSDMAQHKFNFADSDADCPQDPSSWSPTENFSKLVWHSVYCTAGLRDICVKNLDVNAGQGLNVMVRTIGKFGAPEKADNPCDCISCSSIAFSKYTLTIDAYALITEICELDVFDVGEIYRSGTIEAMALRWAEFFDASIYSELETATPGFTETLGTALACNTTLEGSCCTNPGAFELYHAIIDLDAAMRESSIRPDYVIVSPTIAAYFKYKDNVDIPYVMRGQVIVQDGILMKIGQLKVIEYCGANTCTDESGQELAIVIDSSRAVGMVFGKPPKAERDRNIDCDSETVAMWCYVGFGELDTDCIGHVVNP